MRTSETRSTWSCTVREGMQATLGVEEAGSTLIVVYIPLPPAALQVIYQFAKIVTGSDISIKYPEPAKTVNNALAGARERVLASLADGAHDLIIAI